MADLCDVNVLVALCHARHQHHTAALRWIEGLNTPGSAGLCRITQLGLLRLLNNRSVMADDVCTSDAAWRIYDELLADERFCYHDEPPNLGIALRQFTSGHSFAPKLWQDAYLAAFSCAAGLRMVSFDGGLGQYPGVKSLILTD